MATQQRGRGAGKNPVSIPGNQGTARDDEPASGGPAAGFSAAGLAVARPTDMPSEGDDPGDDTRHEIVMGSDDSDAGAGDVDRGEFTGVSTDSFALPELHAKSISASSDPGNVAVASITGGIDNRNQINNTRKYPFRAICALLMTGANGKQSIGTGWFAGDNLIVTAGHNLFDNEIIGQGWIDRVQVWPGRNGNSTWETEVADRSQLGVSDSWRSRAPDRDLLDYGIIRLKTGLGSKVGWFGLKYWPSSQLQGKKFNVVGYPQGVGRIASWTMWYDIGLVTFAGQKTLQYQMDTTPGESGSPVVAWVDDRTASGSMIVVGIHNYGKGNVNQATRITPSVLDTINQLSS